MAKSSTSFKKGNRGGGRPKVVEEFRAKARRIADEVVIAKWEREVLKGGPNWMRASELLAAYGYGKPPQSVTVSGDPANPVRHVCDLRFATDEELDTFERVLARGATSGTGPPKS